MQREERVTVQGPVKEQQPDGMSHTPSWTPPPPDQSDHRGKKRNLQYVGPFLIHKLSTRRPPPPSSNTPQHLPKVGESDGDRSHRPLGLHPQCLPHPHLPKPVAFPAGVGVRQVWGGPGGGGEVVGRSLGEGGEGERSILAQRPNETIWGAFLAEWVMGTQIWPPTSSLGRA